MSKETIISCSAYFKDSKLIKIELGVSDVRILVESYNDTKYTKPLLDISNCVLHINSFYDTVAKYRKVTSESLHFRDADKIVSGLILA